MPEKTQYKEEPRERDSSEKRTVSRSGLLKGAAAAAAIARGTPAAALAAPSGSAAPSVRFPLLPFTNYSENPIMKPNPENDWESRFVYNPAAIVRDQQVYMLYRAQGPDLVSRIGLATSQDGIHFIRRTRPVMEPTQPYESQGCEDPGSCR
jgi:hypothetical protein